MRYLHRRTQIEAFRLGSHELPGWFINAVKSGFVKALSDSESEDPNPPIELVKSWFINCPGEDTSWSVHEGDFIYRKDDGHLGCMSSEEFLAKYETDTWDSQVVFMHGLPKHVGGELAAVRALTGAVDVEKTGHNTYLVRYPLRVGDLKSLSDPCTGTVSLNTRQGPADADPPKEGPPAPSADTSRRLQEVISTAPGGDTILSECKKKKGSQGRKLSCFSFIKKIFKRKRRKA